MTFTVNSLVRCAGLNHWTLTVTVAGTQYVISTTPADMSFDPAASLPETRDRMLERLRSAAKEGGANTFAQVQTAIVGKSFQI